MLLQVLHRGKVEWLTPTVVERVKKMQALRPITADELFPGTFGQRLYKPILGACYELPSRAIGRTPTVTLETDLPKARRTRTDYSSGCDPSLSYRDKDSRV